MKGCWVTYIPEELAWIEANCTRPRAELHAAFCFRFGRKDVTVDQIKALCQRRGWKSGRTGCFVKGQVPPNKGKPMPYHPNSAATRFKKGQRPLNKQDVGYEAIDRDGYLKVCLAAPNPWTGAPTYMAFKHRWLWETLHGPVPKDHVLKCLDGDKTNTDPSNWECIPRALLPRLSGRWNLPYDEAPPEIKPTLLALAKLQNAAREAKRKEKA